MRQQNIILSAVIGALLVLTMSLPVQAGGKHFPSGYTHSGHSQVRHGQGSRDYRVRQGFALESGTPGHTPLRARKPVEKPPGHFHHKPPRHGIKVIPARIVYWQPKPAPELEPEPHSYDFARPFSYFQERADLYIHHGNPDPPDQGNER